MEYAHAADIPGWVKIGMRGGLSPRGLAIAVRRSCPLVRAYSRLPRLLVRLAPVV